MAGFTVNQLEAIEKAIASGTLRVRYDGKEVQYQDMASLMKARNLIRDELIANGLLTSSGGNARGKSTVAEYSRD
jgi:hypothetical protein